MGQERAANLYQVGGGEEKWGRCDLRHGWFVAGFTGYPTSFALVRGGCGLSAPLRGAEPRSRPFPKPGGSPDPLYATFGRMSSIAGRA
ncbi:hypothetical protein GCM10009612_15980 [Streptomyces beijiangensis]